ncbi:hypothetical protein B0T16DRAFT_516388 [Cercophora newfieldiana]|uniref:Cysteine proteinase n=1 Tax=Cercophora newfieldiana TaxID=92897 RepID=A0AA39XYH3_9PEZI|nr:hypothetical protein B0T16DRAFT_516388 [Cercophora newfieldiana]
MSAKTPAPVHTGLGYIPDEYDGRDRVYKYGGSKTPEQLTSADIRSQYKDWPILHQGHTNSCVAHAAASVLQFLVYTNRVSHSNSVPWEFSRLFIYYNARAIGWMAWKNKTEWPDMVQDKGTKTRYALKSLSQLGAASQDAYPWRVQADTVLHVNERPTDEAYSDAEMLHAVEYFRLDPDHTLEAEKNFSPKQKDDVGELTLLRVKQCLDEGYPVIFGFSYYWPKFTTTPAGAGDDGFNTIKDLQGVHEAPPRDAHGWAKYGAHAVIAVAFDDAKKRILCKNSWGANNPFFWMSYTWILDFEATDDFWTVRGLSGGPPSSRLRLPRPQTVNIHDPSYKLTTLPWTTTMSISPSATIAAFSRDSETAEFYLTNSTGQLTSGSYSSSSGWQQGGIIGDQHTSTGPVSILKLGTHNIAAFFKSADLVIQSMRSWPPEPLTQAGGASVHGGLTALSRFPGHEEVFWVAPDGSIQAKYRYLHDTHEWKAYEFAPKGHAHVESCLASAASADGKEMFVWWVTPDGHPAGMRWADDGTGVWWKRLKGDFETYDAVTNGRIAMVVKGNECLVYWFGTVGEISKAVCSGGKMSDGEVGKLNRKC